MGLASDPCLRPGPSRRRTSRASGSRCSCTACRRADHSSSDRARSCCDSDVGRDRGEDRVHGLVCGVSGRKRQFIPSFARGPCAETRWVECRNCVAKRRRCCTRKALRRRRPGRESPESLSTWGRGPPPPPSLGHRDGVSFEKRQVERSLVNKFTSSQLAEKSEQTGYHTQVMHWPTDTENTDLRRNREELSIRPGSGCLPRVTVIPTRPDRRFRPRQVANPGRPRATDPGSPAVFA